MDPSVNVPGQHPMSPHSNTAPTSSLENDPPTSAEPSYLRPAINAITPPPPGGLGRLLSTTAAPRARERRNALLPEPMDSVLGSSQVPLPSLGPRSSFKFDEPDIERKMPTKPSPEKAHLRRIEKTAPGLLPTATSKDAHRSSRRHPSSEDSDQSPFSNQTAFNSRARHDRGGRHLAAENNARHKRRSDVDDARQSDADLTSLSRDSSISSLLSPSDARGYSISSLLNPSDARRSSVSNLLNPSNENQTSAENNHQRRSHQARDANTNTYPLTNPTMRSRHTNEDQTFTATSPFVTLPPLGPPQSANFSDTSPASSSPDRPAKGQGRDIGSKKPENTCTSPLKRQLPPLRSTKSTNPLDHSPASSSPASPAKRKGRPKKAENMSPSPRKLQKLTPDMRTKCPRCESKTTSPLQPSRIDAAPICDACHTQESAGHGKYNHWEECLECGRWRWVRLGRKYPRHCMECDGICARCRRQTGKLPYKISKCSGKICGNCYDTVGPS
ncbi:hypothetical protein K458DRAFT_490278 [Lentithecium fluviatile CBS 122367]|uniref:Uncharacterized protein n=1 Tax=Lentithecium fluviatile CBS 122367 TaxID=1168545 RepID=A0A6G1INQ8_9PLEO|nr:hypothetical protein K458DRAFT_490278 [Lentithecium fluviatile CBS 122367]